MAFSHKEITDVFIERADGTRDEITWSHLPDPDGGWVIFFGESATLSNGDSLSVITEMTIGDR